MENTIITTEIQPAKFAEPLKRRAFMKYAGASAGAQLLDNHGSVQVDQAQSQ